MSAAKEVKNLNMIMKSNECSGDIGIQFTNQGMVAGVKDAQFFSFLGFIASPHIFEYICECRRDSPGNYQNVHSIRMETVLH